MIPSTTASAIPAATIRRSLAMITSTELTPLAQRSVTTAGTTRLEWHLAQNGLVAVTWTSVWAHRLGTSSAWNGSWHLPRSAAVIPTRPRRLISLLTHGVVRPLKAVRLIHCKLLLMLKPLLAL